MATRDRLERLTDLVLVLLSATAPRTLEEIALAVPGYPEPHEARRQAFERDKRLLRDEGIPLLTEPVDGPEQFGYRIDPDTFYLPDLGLEPDEQGALHLAVAGVHLGDPSGRDALAKLGAAGIAEARPVAALVPPPGLAALFAAVRNQAEVRFAYRGGERVVAPATLRFRGGRWYLVGWDRGRDAARTFRVDRIEGSPRPGPAGSGLVPAGLDAGQPPGEPWWLVDGDEDEQVLVWVDPIEAPRVVAEVGDRAVTERRVDGSVVLGLGTALHEVLRSWVLGLLDHAEVLGPPAVRAATIEWLEAIGTASAGDVGDVGGSEPVPDADPDGGQFVGPTGGPVVDRHPPPVTRQRLLPAAARLRRLLAIVAWLAEVGEAPVHEITARFDIGEAEVVRELELAACCGLPPYSPDALLEIVVTEETVQAFLPRELARPRRLTPAEGLALAASARTILAVPGADRDGALARALAKLDAVLGDHHRLVIELDVPPLLPEVRALADAGTQAEIEYHSGSTDETTVRVVDPLAVLSLDGHWYLDAYCHRAGGVRRFRVDRIRRLESRRVPIDHHGGDRGGTGGAGVDVTGGGGTGGLGGGLAADGPDRVGRPEAFVPGPSAVQVRLVLAPEARWVVDTVPVLEERAGPSGTTEVTLAVGGTAWLERLLLQLGPHASVVAPRSLARAGAEAAARVLARYVLDNMKDNETC